MDTNSANEVYNHFTGSQRYYQYYSLMITDGIKALIEEQECFWFMDILWINQMNIKEPFQVWELKRLKGGNFVYTCEDGNKNILIKEKIISDFKYDYLKIYLIDGVVLFPSEY